MEITDIMKASDSYTDEICSEVWARYFINQAIAQINASLHTRLPLLNSEDSEYSKDILSDGWQNLLLVTYVCWGVKMNDTSLNEADRYMNQFVQNLNLLKNTMSDNIPVEYTGGSQGDGSNNDGLGGVYQVDTTGAINLGWFGNSGGRGGH